MIHYTAQITLNHATGLYYLRVPKKLQAKHDLQRYDVVAVTLEKLLPR